MSRAGSATARRERPRADEARARAAGSVVATAVAQDGRRAPLALAAAGFAAILAYAVIRYAVVKGEPLSSLPLWMTNKAVAVFAVALLAAAALRPAAAWCGPARSLALGAAALHGLASLALLRPAYYRSLFEGGPGGRMTAAGELALLCGAAALVAFAALRPARRDAGEGARSIARTATAGVVLVLAHCVALGLPGWLSPARWPGGLPPMSLVGAVLAAVTLGAGVVTGRARARRDRAARPFPHRVR